MNQRMVDLLKKFVIDGREFAYEGPKSVIEGLCSMQAQKYSYDEFFQVIKRRLRLWTGDDQVAFYNEDQVVDLLLELDQVSILD